MYEQVLDIYQWIESDLAQSYFLLLLSWSYSVLIELIQNYIFKVTATIKSRMMTEGSIMISYQPLGEFPNFFRSIISNQAVQEEDIDFMLETIERLGHDL